MKDILLWRIASHLMSQCCGVTEERTAGPIQKEHSDPEDPPRLPDTASVYSSRVQLISADLRSRVRCRVQTNFSRAAIRSVRLEMENLGKSRKVSNRKLFWERGRERGMCESVGGKSLLLWYVTHIIEVVLLQILQEEETGRSSGLIGPNLCYWLWKFYDLNAVGHIWQKYCCFHWPPRPELKSNRLSNLQELDQTFIKNRFRLNHSMLSLYFLFNVCFLSCHVNLTQVKPTSAEFQTFQSTKTQPNLYFHQAKTGIIWVLV